jgi:dihydrofolate reductase
VNRIIVAVDPNGVIGVDSNMPWHYKADFKRFKERTMGGTLIMGRTTWESLPKPLPGRRCIVLTSNLLPQSKHPPGSCEYYWSWDLAMAAADNAMGPGVGGHAATNADLWIAGGARVYREALELGVVHEIDYTLVPEVPTEKLATGCIYRFPKDLLDGFTLMEETVNAEDPRLMHRIYRCTLQPSN